MDRRQRPQRDLRPGVERGGGGLGLRELWRRLQEELQQGGEVRDFSGRVVRAPRPRQPPPPRQTPPPPSPSPSQAAPPPRQSQLPSRQAPSRPQTRTARHDSQTVYRHDAQVAARHDSQTIYRGAAFPGFADREGANAEAPPAEGDGGQTALPASPLARPAPQRQALSPAMLRQAILLNEIIGPPKALRPPGEQ